MNEGPLLELKLTYFKTTFCHEMIKKLGSTTNITYSDWRPADQKVFYVDIRKVSETLGWKPEVGVEEGVKRLYEWAKANV